MKISPAIRNITFFAISTGDEKKFVLAIGFIFGHGQSSQGSYDENRPWVVPLPDSDLKNLWEYDTLAAIHFNIDSLRDHRFGSVCAFYGAA